jgi:WD40 repeat protein
MASRTSGPARHGVFISYARADGEAAARALHARLEAEVPDIPAWLDRFEIEGGAGWWNQIEQELDRAEFLVLIITPSALRSDNTRNEWRSARQRGVCVYPVKSAPDAALDFAGLPNWMRKVHFYDGVAEWPKLVAHLRRGCRATRVPFMAPPLPASFVARPSETEALFDLVLRDKRDPVAITTALRGAGGFGKTTLAAAICHDDRAQEAFDDGILWATLGQSPNLLNELVKLYAALTGERPGFVDVEDAARELALKLEAKNCLIVIDDAWNAAHVKPFLRGGPGCARLITTRLFDVASEAKRIDVDEMTPAEALQLLLARAGARPDDSEPFRRLVAKLGEWPLPIALAGAAIRLRVERGDTLPKALDYVVRALDKRGITAFDRSQASARQDAVSKTLAASIDLLNPDEQQRYIELAIFPEDVAVPISTVTTLWQLDELDAEDLARKLDDLALVDLDLRLGKIRMHDLLRGFLAARLPDATVVHRRLLDAWGDPYQLPSLYAWRSFAYHSRHAGRDGSLRALLLDVRWLEAKLLATDIHALIADFEHAAPDRVVELVRGALRLSVPALATDPRQLRTQLDGRLRLRDEPEIQELRKAALDGAEGQPLRLLHPTLDAPGGMLVMTLVGHDHGVTSLASDTDGRWIVSGSEDGTVRVWDAGDGQQLRVLARHKLGVRAVALSGSGLALVGCADGVIRLWEVEGGELVRRLPRNGGRAPTAVALSLDGRVAVCASRGRDLRVWDTGQDAAVRILTGHTDQVTAVAVSADGTRAVSGSDDCTIRLWNLATGQLTHCIEAHDAAVNAVALSGDGRFALSGSSDHSVKLWNAETGELSRTLEGHQASVTSVALAAAGWRAISGSSDRSVTLWDLRDGRSMAQLEGHSDAVTAVTIDAEGTRAATCSVDRTIKLWNLDVARSAARVDAHAGAVSVVVFSGDGRLCASGGDDGRVKVRQVDSGRVIRTMEAHSAPVRSLAFTPDADCVLSAGVDDNYWLWTIETGAPAWMPVRHADPVDCCALSGLARYLITSCGDRFVYLRDVPSGAVIERYGTRTLFDHLITPNPRRAELIAVDENYRDSYLGGESVYDVIVVRMSADGAFAVFSAVRRDPGTVRSGAQQTVDGRACLLVLDVASGEIRSACVPQDDPVGAFAIDGAADRLLLARADHAVEVWDLHAGRRLTVLRGHTEKVNAVTFTSDGSRAISCGRDRSVRVWSVAGGGQIASFTADAALRALALSPNGDILAAGDVAGRVHMLSLNLRA